MIDLKHPLGFANWNILIGFLISWGLWWVLAITLFKWEWLTIHDGFEITCIFTVSSWIRQYGMNKFQHWLIRRYLINSGEKYVN